MRAFPLTLAMRHLRCGGGQTLLTVGTVTMGVLLVVFASALMYGVRRHVREMDEVRDDRRAARRERAQPWARGFARGRPAQVQRDVAGGEVIGEVGVRVEIAGAGDAIGEAMRGDVGADVVVGGGRKLRASALHKKQNAMAASARDQLHRLSPLD